MCRLWKRCSHIGIHLCTCISSVARSAVGSTRVVVAMGPNEARGKYQPCPRMGVVGSTRRATMFHGRPKSLIGPPRLPNGSIHCKIFLTNKNAPFHVNGPHGDNVFADFARWLCRCTCVLVKKYYGTVNIVNRVIWSFIRHSNFAAAFASYFKNHYQCEILL